MKYGYDDVLNKYVSLSGNENEKKVHHRIRCALYFFKGNMVTFWFCSVFTAVLRLIIISWLAVCASF